MDGWIDWLENIEMCEGAAFLVWGILWLLSGGAGMSLVIIGAVQLDTGCHHEVLANVTHVARLPDWSCNLSLVYIKGGKGDSQVEEVAAFAKVPSCDGGDGGDGGDDVPRVFFEGCYNHFEPHEVFAATTRDQSDVESDRACLIAGIVLLSLFASPLAFVLVCLAAWTTPSASAAVAPESTEEAHVIVVESKPTLTTCDSVSEMPDRTNSDM